ncbi:MAG: NosD domain-containing protein [Candidatus Heimdallarchaeaceae archaeon]
MRRNVRFLVIIHLVFVLSLGFSLNRTLGNKDLIISSSEKDEKISFIQNDLSPSNPIVITNNADFETKYNFTGYGTKISPYLINNLSIISESTIGIDISGVTMSFIIENCYLNTIEAGIRLVNVNSALVQLLDNTCENTVNGIVIQSSSTITIENNILSKNEFGLHLYESQNLTVTSNIFSENTQIGCKIETCNETEFSTNNLLDNYIGLNFLNSRNLSVNYNTFKNCGVLVEGYSDYIISCSVDNNTINGLKLGFFKEIGGFTINMNEYGQIILLGTPNVVIENQNMANSSYPIFISRSPNCVIRNNALSASIRGIYVRYSDNVTITSNTCENNLVGIDIYLSAGADISNNLCNMNYNGINLQGSNTADVFQNRILNNRGYGIYLSSSSCLITYNDIENNEDYGIRNKIFCRYNSIHHNSFKQNKVGILSWSQAKDGSERTYWYDNISKQGNYWDDWDGSGSYSIDGIGGAEDPYPLSNTAPPPTTRPTYDTSIKEGNIHFFTIVVSIFVTSLVLLKRYKRKSKK